jgi:hypothetical protein
MLKTYLLIIKIILLITFFIHNLVSWIINVINKKDDCIGLHSVGIIANLINLVMIIFITINLILILKTPNSDHLASYWEYKNIPYKNIILGLFITILVLHTIETILLYTVYKDTCKESKEIRSNIFNWFKTIIHFHEILNLFHLLPMSHVTKVYVDDFKTA